LKLVLFIENEEYIIDFINDLDKNSHLKRIILKPFNNQDMENYVERLIGSKNDNKTFIDSILDIAKNTGGNPYYFEQILKMMIEKEAITRNDANWTIKADFDSSYISGELKDTLRARILAYNFNLEDYNLLKYLAVFNNPVTINFFAEVTQKELKQIVNFFSQLQDKELVTEKSGQYLLANHLYSEVILLDLSNQERDFITFLIADKLDSSQMESIAAYYDKIVDVEKDFFIDKMLPLMLDYAKNLYYFGNKNQAVKIVDKLEKLSENYLDDTDTNIEQKYKLYELKGLILNLLSENNQSLIAFNKALSLISNKDEYRDKEINTLIEIGKVYIELGEMETAEKLYEQALDSSTTAIDQNIRIHVLVEVAAINIITYKPDKAMELLMQAEEIAFSLHDDLNFSPIYNKMGVIYQRKGEYEKTLDYYQKAMKFNNNNKFNIASDLGNMANLCKYMKKFDLSLQYYQDSLNVFIEVGNRQATAMTLGNLGMLYSQLKDPERSLDCHQKQIRISKEIGFKLGLASGYLSLANLSNDAGKQENALQFYQKALGYYEELNDFGGLAGVKINIGFLDMQMGNYQKAVTTLLESLETTTKLGMKLYRTYSQLFLSLTYFSMNKFEEALKYNQEAKIAFTEINDIIKVELCSFNHLKNYFYQSANKEEKEARIKDVKDFIKDKKSENFEGFLYDYWKMLNLMPQDSIYYESKDFIKQKCLEILHESYRKNGAFATKQMIDELEGDGIDEMDLGLL